MTQRSYAEHAGITHGYVNYLVKKGMPMDSVEAADAWRQKNVRRAVANDENAPIMHSAIKGAKILFIKFLDFIIIPPN